jgi:hypothetical protein
VGVEAAAASTAYYPLLKFRYKFPNRAVFSCYYPSAGIPCNPMTLEHGSREEHLATLQRAKAGGLRNVWSGDIRRNRYLSENLKFGEEEKIIDLEWYDNREDQESGYKVKWLKNP